MSSNSIAYFFNKKICVTKNILIKILEGFWNNEIVNKLLIEYVRHLLSLIMIISRNDYKMLLFCGHNRNEIFVTANLFAAIK